jgi:uncharacterized membrane protein
VRRRRFAIAVILTISIGPMPETFDRWDNTAQDGNDTEANIVVVALCVGFAVSLAGIVLARIREMSSSRLVARSVALDPAPFGSFTLHIPGPTSSPPTPLRI